MIGSVTILKNTSFRSTQGPWDTQQIHKKIYKRSTGDLHHIHRRFTPDPHQIDTRSTRDPHQIYTRSTQDPHKIHKRSTQYPQGCSDAVIIFKLLEVTEMHPELLPGSETPSFQISLIAWVRTWDLFCSRQIIQFTCVSYTTSFPAARSLYKWSRPPVGKQHIRQKPCH